MVLIHLVSTTQNRLYTSHYRSMYSRLVHFSKQTNFFKDYILDYMQIRILTITLVGFLCSLALSAQRIIHEHGASLDSIENVFKSGDSIDSKSVPKGIYTWRTSPYFGDVIPTRPDTVSHLFPNSNYTMGETMQYSHTGNIGAPRISRIFRSTSTLHSPFIFSEPLDYFYKKPHEVVFTNTKSPFTNITYHSRGDRTTGDDHFKLLFATNVNRRLGFGVDVDYVYGRGYYGSQATSLLNGRLHGSYIGQMYQSHFFIESDYTKMGENGGLEEDGYIITPQNYSANYSTRDYPTRLNNTWTRTGQFRTYFTQRYHLGIHRTYLPDGTLVKEDNMALGKKLTQLTDTTLTATIDSAQLVALTTKRLSTLQDTTTTDGEVETPQYIKHFIPVISLIHTLQLDQNYRKFTQNATPTAYYTNSPYYSTAGGSNDKTEYFNLSNLLGIEIIEGFNKWVKAGMKLFVRYDLRSFKLPLNSVDYQRYNENLLSVGAQLYSYKSKFVQFDTQGELATDGDSWGLFNIEGKAKLNLPLAHDTLKTNFMARFANERPTFYYRHYHSHHTWWDNIGLNNIITSHLGGELQYKRIGVRVDIHSLQNYTYFAETATPTADNKWGYTTALGVKQANKNIQILALTASQGFSWKALHGEIKATYQATSDADALPLPSLTAYANLFLRLRVAKVLGVELGIDGTYFTKYYGPTYAPVIGHFVTQDATYRTQVGNYPVLNAYANFSLSKCRFYISYRHLNASGDGGRSFFVPHYPLNPRGLQLGISWTFLN